MNGHLGSECALGHERFMDMLDQHANKLGAGDGSPDPAARLKACQVFLVAGGNVGVETAVRLSRLPVGHLSIYPLSAKDLGMFQPAMADARCTWNVFPNAFNIYGAALQLKMHQVLMFAASRPAPAVQRELNATAIRLDMPFVQASVFAHEVVLGPTVIPGHTACHDCYRTRLDANYGRTEVPRARDHFLDRNPEFEFKGQLDATATIAGSLATAELERLVTGTRPPLALSREVLVNVLSQGRQDSFVPYLEWCPTCSGARPVRVDTVFRDFVRRASAGTQA